MAYTEEQLNLLQAALAKGERRVTFADKTVEYRSVGELMEAILAVEQGLARQAQASGAPPSSPRQIRVNTSKGF